MKQEDIQNLPLLPLRDLVVFPHMMMPLFVGREKSTKALQHAMSEKTDIVLSAQKEARNYNPTPDQIHTVGTVGAIIQHLKLPDGTVKALVEGKHRVHINNFIQVDSFFTVQASPVVENIKADTEANALKRMVYSSFENYVKLNKQVPPEVLARVYTIENFSELADNIASQLNLKMEDKQSLLETFDPGERLRMVLKHITREIEILKVERKLRTRVKEQMERSQKEYYLNEQLQAIQKELGEKDDFHKEVQELEEKAAKMQWTKEAKEKTSREIKKLKMMSPMSAEAAVIRNYIDWVISLPWQNYVKEKRDIRRAEEILNEDHWGLHKVKERILEYLAVRTIAEKPKSPIICFIGPPGVGKTSLARSIARALGRPFTRISLGGVQDEAEIRGHRRTYVGALPGKLIQSLRKVKHGNPLFLLDEIDKISSSFRGDPSSALLEVLDPEQNHTFQDHYLEVDYDLSSVLFITTANSLHGIPRPLMDRMEMIHIEGYTENEKLNIAEKYLLPKQVEKHGLKKYAPVVKKEVLKEVIRYYTREAGVRELERQIAKLCRKLVKEIVFYAAQNQGGEQEKTATRAKKSRTKRKPMPTPAIAYQNGHTDQIDQKDQIDQPDQTNQKDQVVSPPLEIVKKYINYSVSSARMKEYLGVHRFKYGKVEKRSEIGLTNGLAWTETGGDLLAIEASILPGKGKFTFTGQLGDVMKESCSAALSYVRSRGPLFELSHEFFEKHDFHIHVPEGAVPKDGPSAGVAITTSLVSACMRFPVKKTVAMTGEITLRGRVLPIGGLKEKILAAHREGIKTVIIPKENEKDLKDKDKGMPQEILSKIEIITVDHVDQVLVNSLEIKSAQDLFKRRSEKLSGLKAKYTGHIQIQQH